MRHDATRYEPAIRKGWRFLLSSWQRTHRDPDIDKYSIEDAAKRDGWSLSLIREAIELYQPFLTVERSFVVRAPEAISKPALGTILRLDVEYPRPHEPIDIPDDVLGYAVALFRQQLEGVVRRNWLGSDM